MPRLRSFKKNAVGASDMIYKKIVDGFNRKEPYVFHKVVTKWMVHKDPSFYQLEVPYPFAVAHGEKFAEVCTFERDAKISDRKWEMEITMKNFPTTKQHRFFIYGSGGWKTFALENQVKVGDLLVFCLIEFSRFQVFIYRNQPVRIPVVHTNHGELQLATIKRGPAENTLNYEHKHRCYACGQATPYPQFETRVSLPHMEVQVGFWVQHRRMLRTNVILLQGPSKAVMEVHVWKYSEKMNKTYQLEEGWAKFAVANMLNIGDTLRFSMVGECRFKVEVVENRH